MTEQSDNKPSRKFIVMSLVIHFLIINIAFSLYSAGFSVEFWTALPWLPVMLALQIAGFYLVPLVPLAVSTWLCLTRWRNLRCLAVTHGVLLATLAFGIAGCMSFKLTN